MREATLEEKILKEVSDIAVSGNGAQVAFSRFKDVIYDLLETDEKHKAKEILLSILREI